MSSHPTNSIPNSLQTPFFSDESESDHESGLLATCKPPNPHPDQVNREEDLSGVLEAGIESEELEDDIQARDTLLNEQVIKSGYLLKRSQKRTMGRGWQKRWFVLRTTKLCYYKDEKEYKLLKVIDLRDVTSVAQVPRRKRVNVLGIVTNERKYYLQAPDTQSRQEWEEAIKILHKQLRKTMLEKASTVAAMTAAAVVGTPVSTAAVTAGIGPGPGSSAAAPMSAGGVKPNVLIKANTGMALVTSATTVLSPRIGNFGGGKQISSVGTNDEQLLMLQSPTKAAAGNSDSEIDEDEDGEEEEVEVLMRPSLENLKKSATSNTTTTAATETTNLGLKGVLKKKGSDNKRYFVLDNGKLAYHRNEQETIPIRVIPLSDVRAVQIIHSKRPTKSTNFKFRVQTTERDYLLMARTQEEREAWCQTIMKEKARLPAQSSNVVKSHLLQAAH